MQANEVTVLIALGVLNAAVAVLAANARPSTLATRLATLLFALNAASAFLPLAAHWADVTWGVGAWQVLQRVDNVANELSLVPLALLPFVFPWRRLGERATRAVFAVVTVGILTHTVVLTSHIIAPEGPLASPFFHNLGAYIFWGVFNGAGAVGALVLLDAFLSATAAATRRQAAFLLAAYYLKTVMLLLGAAGNGWRVTFGAAADGALAGFVPIGNAALVLLIAVAAIAVPVGLVAARLRRREAAGDVAGNLLVFGMVPIAFLMSPGVGGFFADASLEYLLIRPLLLAFGMLQFGLLEVDARRHAGTLAAGIVAALGALFVAVSSGLAPAGVPAETRMGIALVAALGIGTALAFPVLRLASPRAQDESRRLVVYRAALASAAREGRAASAFDDLRALREDLDVSVAEHERLAERIAAEEADFALAPGNLFLARYRVLRQVGRGGFGEVWLARDERLGRDVAIKRMGADARRDAAALELFRREARLASTLVHPNVVAVHDVEVLRGDAFLVMEYVEGGSLAERIARAPLPEREAVAVALDVLAALEALHARGILHRDVKPSNVLLDGKGRAKLSDFTVAREVVSGETVGFTGAHGPVGTLAFMAPEQARGLPATEQSDLYSLAATLHAALTGKPPVPVEGLSEFEARLRILDEAPALPLDGVSGRVNDALARALAKDPADRFASAQEMARGLAAAPVARP